MENLTRKQQEVFNFIKFFIEKNDYPPAIRDICKGVNLSSPSSVHAHINTLCELGYLKKDILKKKCCNQNNVLFG